MSKIRLAIDIDVDLSGLMSPLNLTGASLALFGNEHSSDLVVQAHALHISNIIKDALVGFENAKMVSANMGEIEDDEDDQDDFDFNFDEDEYASIDDDDDEEDDEYVDVNVEDLIPSSSEESQKVVSEEELLKEEKREEEIMNDKMLRQLFNEVFKIIGSGGEIQTILYNSENISEKEMARMIEKLANIENFGVKFDSLEPLNSSSIVYKDLVGENKYKQIKLEDE